MADVLTMTLTHGLNQPHDGVANFRGDLERALPDATVTEERLMRLVISVPLSEDLPAKDARAALKALAAEHGVELEKA